MKQARLLFVILTLVLLGHPAFAALPAGDLFVVPAGDLEQALGTVIAETQTQLTGGAAVGGLFSSPVFIASLMALFNAVLVFLTTNSFKLSTLWLRGKKTLTLAALLSALTSGLGVWFGPGAALGLPERIALSVVGALGTLAGARGIQETKRQIETKQRLPERKSKGRSPAAQLTVMGLKAFAQKLGIPGAAFIVDALLTDHNIAQAEQMIKNMARERPLTGEESDELLDAYEAANILKPAELAAARAKLAARRNRAAVAVAPAG